MATILEIQVYQASWMKWLAINYFGPDIDDYGQMGLRADYCLTIGSTFIF
jgi:hypothetical protein